MLCPQVLRQRLQSLFTGDGCLCAPLWLVGEIQVFQFVPLERGFNPGFQLVGQFSLFTDGSKNRLAPIDKLAEIGQLLLDGTNLNLVEITSGLFAVARNERNSAAIIQQFRHGNESSHRYVEAPRNMKNDFGRECFVFAHVLYSFIVHGARVSAPWTTGAGMAAHCNALHRVCEFESVYGEQLS